MKTKTKKVDIEIGDIIKEGNNYKFNVNYESRDRSVLEIFHGIAMGVNTEEFVVRLLKNITDKNKK